MILYRKAKQDDLESLGKLTRRVEGSVKYEGIIFPIPSFSQEQLKSFIETGKCYLAIERRVVIALAIVEKDVSSYFYPLSHDGGKLMEVIGKTDWKMSEDVMVLFYLSVDPLHRHKKVGREMLSYIEREFPRFLFLSSLDPSNERGIEYLRKNGYKRVDLEDFEFSKTPQQLLFKRL